jgi:hypothetical protein
MSFLKGTSSYFRELNGFKGTQSAGRFGFLYSVLVSNTVVWYVWLFVCIWTRTIVDIPVGVYTMYGLANGVAFAGKGFQAFAEKQEANTSTTTETMTKSTVGETKKE